MLLKNTSVLITGASKGLGRALSLQLAELGAKVALVARHRIELEGVAREIIARGGEALPLVYDVGRKDAVHAIVGAAAAAHGPIRLLVNNASTLGKTPLVPLLDGDCEDFEQTLAVNVLGPYRLMQAIVGHMALERQGAVVNISSDAATSAYPRWGFYGASKAALHHLTKIWAEELPELRFLSFDPGEMDTEMHRAAIPDADPSTLLSPDVVARRLIAELL